MNVQAIIFSKDRAFQLQAALASFALRCADATQVHLRVLYKASTARHERQYRTLRTRFPQAQFVAETDFQPQLMHLIADAPHVLFLVDDVVFHRPFTLRECLEALDSQPQALAFSLLLGENATHCHTRDQTQATPPVEPVAERIVRFAWQEAELDFGYPLEVSGSIYRSSHILALLHDIAFDNPNRLESALSLHTGHMERFPYRLMFRDSAGFCIPLNRVQNVFANRIAKDVAVDAETLADWFDQGQAMDVEALEGTIPNAAHFEVPVRLRRAVQACAQDLAGNAPRVSVIIPVYNGAAFLPDAVASLAAQDYQTMDVIIVNDGSQDDSLAVAEELARRYPALHIQTLDKENGGLADARNAGIRLAKGDWILPLDCDDRLDQGFLRQAEAIITEKPDVNLVFANMEEFGTSNKQWGTKEYSWAALQERNTFPYTPMYRRDFLEDEEFETSNKQWRPKEYSWTALQEQNTFPYASLYRRELWEYAGGYDPCVPWGAEDWNFWLACAPFGLKPHRIDAPLFFYRVHPDGSMYTRMMEYWDEVKACLRTTRPALFPVSQLIADHEILSSLSPETLERIEEILVKHPALPMPWFWRGLTHEALGRHAEALADYARSAALAPYAQWQPQLRMFFLNRAMGRKTASQRNAQAVLARRPELAQVFRLDPNINLKQLLPLNLAINSNVSQWQAMQENNYFDTHKLYLDEQKRLKDFGDDLEWIERRRPLNKTMRVVVIGCGYGRETAMIAPKTDHVWGIDVSQRILNKCSRRLRSKGIGNFTPVKTDAWKTEIPNQIDFVYCITVFQHLTRDLVEDYILGLAKKLAPDGSFLCQFAELDDGTRDARLEVYEPSVRWNISEIKALAFQAGLTLFEVETLPFKGGLWHWAYFGHSRDENVQQQ